MGLLIVDSYDEPVAKKNRKKRKHIPQRTCVGCRTVESKRSMTRVVRTTDGMIIDHSGKIPGRGAYLHNDKTCWKAGLQGPLSLALKTEISADDCDRLEAYMDSLPDETGISP